MPKGEDLYAAIVLLAAVIVIWGGLGVLLIHGLFY